MHSLKRTLAFIELLLVFPAALFMASLFLRNLQPSPYEPAQTARRLVEWFSARPRFGLGVLLIALPLAAFVIGGVTVIRSWRTDRALRQAALQTVATLRPHWSTLFIAAATLVAVGILAIVAIHVIAD